MEYGQVRDEMLSSLEAYLMHPDPRHYNLMKFWIDQFMLSANAFVFNRDIDIHHWIMSEFGILRSGNVGAWREIISITNDVSLRIGFCYLMVRMMRRADEE